MRHIYRIYFLTFTFVITLFAQETQIEADAYTAEKIANIFYALNGDVKEPHKKINHTTGFCASGEFIPAKNITNRFSIPLLSQASIPVVARFSLGGSLQSDKSKPRGLALKLHGKKDSWELVLLNTEINFAKNPQEFGEFFAMRVLKEGKLDSQMIAKRTQEVESYRNFETYMQRIGISPSVAHTMYHSIHTFYFKDTKTGQFLPARLKVVPTAGIKYLSEQELATKSDSFLESDFKERTQKAPLRFAILLVLANAGDKTDDTTALWSGTHTEVELGTLEVARYEGKGCNGDVFMPNILPNGIDAPKDALFDLRNEVYAITFGRRQ